MAPAETALLAGGSDTSGAAKGMSGAPLGGGGVTSALMESNIGSDVYAQLAQKENDLILAAELGKALLEKNEELKKHNDVLSEDFALKIEVG